MFSIDKDTNLYCSFAEKAGSKGCKFHNAGFQALGINAIYKSFSVPDIESAMFCMGFLNIKGAGITMPFKKKVLDHVHSVTQDAQIIGAANTIVNEDGELVAYNTDWIAAYEFLLKASSGTDLWILGNGGYAAAVRYAAGKLGMKVNVITRSTWHKIDGIRGATIFNCTPVEGIKVPASNYFIDCITSTHTGSLLAKLQAREQFRLYTGQDYPDIVQDTTQPDDSQKTTGSPETHSEEQESQSIHRSSGWSNPLARFGISWPWSGSQKHDDKTCQNRHHTR